MEHSFIVIFQINIIRIGSDEFGMCAGGNNFTASL